MHRHCALLEVQGKNFEITPIVLRTVRPFKLAEVILTQVAEEEGLDLTDKIEINKYLKAKINQLITQANEEFAERNTDAEDPPEPMLPLIRLKVSRSVGPYPVTLSPYRSSYDTGLTSAQVDTTGVAEMSNPIRFGQEFTGKIANPRDVLSFFRSKRSALKKKIQIDQPSLSIDDPELSISEKLSRVRVQTLVKEFLAAQEVQLLAENGMADAIELFVDKDDTHSIEKSVVSSPPRFVPTNFIPDMSVTHSR
jgi:double-strand break repair protein MRE11